MTIVILKDYCFLLIIVVQNLMAIWKLQLIDTHTPLTEKYLRENPRDELRAKDMLVMFWSEDSNPLV